MLVDEIKEHVVHVMIPFWKNLKDEEFGGFFGLVDFNLNLDKKAPKGCILNSRILWFFSNAYKVFQDESLLLYATHAYNFLLKQCYDVENGGVYWSLNYDGTVLDSTKHTYNQAFAIYALSSYYGVTGEKQALETAYELFELIEHKCRDEIGYLEAFNSTFHPIENDKLSEEGIIADKTMNTLLHVFEAYTELYRVTKDQNIGNKMRYIMDIIEENVFNIEKRRQEVFFDSNMNSLLDLHSYGHDIEAAWLVDRGCEILADTVYSSKMRKITDVLEKEIYTIAFNGHSIANECKEGIVDHTRVWWAQAEAMVGFMNGYLKDRDKSYYLEAVIKIWQFIKEHMIDSRENSEWFYDVDSAGNPSSKKAIVEPWKCPYHNGRMCFEIIRRAENAS
ncbi:MAG: AGE family epimerase/isomerase [Lachnotalea sp.]